MYFRSCSFHFYDMCLKNIVNAQFFINRTCNNLSRYLRIPLSRAVIGCLSSEGALSRLWFYLWNWSLWIITEDGKKFLLIMMQVGQMSWHQVKQGFIGSYYHTCLGYPEWHSRPFFVQDFLFCFWENRQKFLGMIGSKCTIISTLLVYTWDVISRPRWLQFQNKEHIQLPANHAWWRTHTVCYYLGFCFHFITSVFDWSQGGQMLQGMQRWLRASHICTQL